MPTYTFINKKSGIEYDEYILLAEYDDYMKKNPDITRVWHGKAPAMVGDHIMGVGPKVDGGFTENMQRIAGAHPGSPLADRFGGSTQTHKEINTRATISKHAKKVARDGFSANRNKTV
jgi:hypothetical protein